MGNLFYDSTLPLFTVVGILLIFLIILIAVLIDNANQNRRKAEREARRQKQAQMKTPEPLFTQSEEAKLKEDASRPVGETLSADEKADKELTETVEELTLNLTDDATMS